MSVLIKGMEMPKSNTMFTVTLRVRQDGTAEFISTSGKTVKSFPMIEVPTPHGRLIDADALMECRLEPNHYEELKDGYIPDYDLDSAPTIIEAEVSE